MLHLFHSKIKSEKKEKNKSTQQNNNTVYGAIYTIHTTKSLKHIQKKKQSFAYTCEFNRGISFFINNASYILVSYSL